MNIKGRDFRYVIEEIVAGKLVSTVTEIIPLNDPETGKVNNDISGMKGQLNALITKILKDARDKGLIEAGTDSDDIVDKSSA